MAGRHVRLAIIGPDWQSIGRTWDLVTSGETVNLGVLKCHVNSDRSIPEVSHSWQSGPF